MKFFSAILCLIPLYFCAGQKRARSEIDLPQDLLAIAFTKGAFKNIPDEIFKHILYFLPFKYRLSFSRVNSFWFSKFNFFRNTNLNYSMGIFLEMTSFPSEVPFKKLLQVIYCFTGYWESLCRNSKDANFLNERPQLQAKLGNWLSVNMKQIMSSEWNTSLNKEGDTLSYILLQRLLFSPYFHFILKHPIWKAMAAHNKIRVQAACDFLLQVPMMLGRIVFCRLYESTENNKQLLQIAVERGIQLELSCDSIHSLTWTNVIHQQLMLLKDIHTEVQTLAHPGVPIHILRLESIILTAIETGSIDIFKNGFFAKSISKNDVNYKTIKGKLTSSGFELAYTCLSSEREPYIISIVSYIVTKHPEFFLFLFRKTLASRMPNQSQILIFLCSSIPKEFEYHQINIVGIVTILWPIVSKLLLPITLGNFCQMTSEVQIDIFKRIIKKEIDRLISNWKANSIRESYACIEKELGNTALFFNTVSPVFPFLYHPIPTEGFRIPNRIELYFLTKIGIIASYETSLVSCGQVISADILKSTPPPCQSRKLTLPDGSVINVLCQPIREDQAQKDGNNENRDDK